MSFLCGSSTVLGDGVQVYPITAFDEKPETPVSLIEVTSNAGSGHRRLVVTEDLIKTYIEKDFGQSDLNSGTARKAPDHESIKMFWSMRAGDYNGKMTPIPISREWFSRIAPYARIPMVYPQLLHNSTAMNTFATPQIPKEMQRPVTSNARQNEHLSFIIQSIPGAMSHVCIGASFTYHFPSKHMYIFTHGLESNNYERFAHIIKHGAAKESAFLVPSILVQCNLEQRLKALNLWQDKVYWNERKLGIRFDHSDNPDPTAIDYSTLSKDLNAVNINLAYVAWSCNNTARQLQFMDEVAKRYRAQAVLNGMSDEAAAGVERLLLDAHAHLRVWNTGLEDRADYLSKRAQALVQTVYSGIAQRDSAISLRLATTSTKLAESSQTVALSTSRDSAVMRVIAAITIFFLPATFTATFFSTSFFSFNANLDGKIYSTWLWLYFLVTIVLTAVVVVGTWMLWKGKEREISRRMEKRGDGEGQEYVNLSVPVAQPPNLAVDVREYVQHEIGTREVGQKSA